MTPEQIALAQGSFQRCCEAPEFFRTFYRLFFESSPDVAAMFEHTDLDRQYRLLKHGLGLLVSYAKRPNPVLLERIAHRHGPGDVDADPALYSKWVDCLVAAAREHDAEFDDTVEAAWRAAVAPGIEYMIAHYRASV